MSALNHRFRRVGIKTKLFAMDLLLIFVPLGLLTVILYGNMHGVFEDHMKRSASQSFRQAHAYLNDKLSQMVTISDAIYFNTDVQDILVKRQADYARDVYQQTIDMQKLDAFLNSFRSDDLYRACLYVPSWFMYARQGRYMDDYGAFSQTDIHKRLIDTKDKVLWVPGERLPYENALHEPVEVISLYRRVRNKSQIADVIGVIRLSIRQSSIDVIVSNADVSEQGVVFVQNDAGQIVSGSNRANLEAFLREPFVEEASEDAQWRTVRVGTEPYILLEQSLRGTDWRMTAAIPYKELLSQSRGILILMFAQALLIGAAAYLLSYLFSRSSVRRITALTEQMRSVHGGGEAMEAVAGTPGWGHDEIDQMVDTFQFMLRRIDALVEQQYQNGKEIKSAELRALQAQINPHFLYNTLDLINWKASEHGAEEIMSIVRALAKFYKLSLGRGRDIVALRDELEHIRAYVQIQNQRFDRGIALVLDVEERFMRCQVPKIILQPLVENAILHGIMCKNPPRGQITVGARLADANLLLSVADDGVGMDAAAVGLLLRAEQNSPNRGYGLFNIDHRIKLCYGQEYGLRLRLPASGGVSAELLLPLVYAEEPE